MAWARPSTVAVEADALTDQGQLRRRRVAPDEVDQARRPRAAAADRVDRGVVLGQQLVADDQIDPGPVGFGELRCGGGQFGRAHVFGRGVDQVAGERQALGQAGHGGAIGAFGPDQARELALGRLVAAEHVGTQGPTERQAGAGARAEQGFAIEAQAIGAFGQAVGQATQRPERVIARNTLDHHRQMPVGTGDQRRLAGLAGEAGRREPGTDGARMARLPFAETVRRHGHDRNAACAVDQRFNHRLPAPGKSISEMRASCSQAISVGKPSNARGGYRCLCKGRWLRRAVEPGKTGAR